MVNEEFLNKLTKKYEKIIARQGFYTTFEVKIVWEIGYVLSLIIVHFLNILVCFRWQESFKSMLELLVFKVFIPNAIFLP